MQSGHSLEAQSSSTTALRTDLHAHQPLRGPRSSFSGQDSFLRVHHSPAHPGACDSFSSRHLLTRGLPWDTVSWAYL